MDTTLRGTSVAGSMERPILVALGVVGLGAVTSLTIFFLVGDPFGILNDALNATVAVLSAVLAWMVRGRVGAVTTALAVAGAAVAVAGSALVISGTTGFFLAGLVSSVGFAGIGAWLVGLARAGQAGRGGVRRLALAAGVLMAVGIATLPGIPMRLDDMATAPAWIWVGFTGWIGTFLLYPIWALVSGRRAR